MEYCTGCKWLGTDNHSPASDHPELTQAWYICLSPNAPYRKNNFMDDGPPDECEQPEWCPEFFGHDTSDVTDEEIEQGVVEFGKLLVTGSVSTSEALEAFSLANKYIKEIYG